MTELITFEAFRLICRKLHPVRIKQLVGYFNTICPNYGINSRDIFHEFFANLCEESAEFTHYEENLTYSTPQRLQKVWPSRFPTLDSALPYVSNPKALAIKVYGARKDLGNISPEDGWMFRGSGPIQITGRAMFTAFAKWMHDRFSINKTPEQWAEVLRSSDEYGIHSAAWLFAIAKKLNDEAERDEMETIVRRINGGLTNYPARLMYYRLVKKYLP